ncbi:MAG: SRPBCC family protein [Flavobacteriales bacterium]|nr:SRPBCC family protein [Flavobacteriales bacterium]
MAKQITISVLVDKPVAQVWKCWTTAADIEQWNAASDDWHCPKALNDLRVDGRFSYTMAARDGSASFDFEGTYTTVEPGARIAYTMDDGRQCAISFVAEGDGTRVTEVFDAENMHSEEQQQAGWQAILERFKQYAESR